MAGEWRELLLKEIAAPVRNALVGGPFGSDLVSADYTGTGVAVIRGENVSQGRWVAGPFAYVSEEKAERLSANTAGPLDIVFTQRGANHFRQVALVHPDTRGRFVISQSQMKITVDQDRADPLFVYYSFRSPTQQEYLQRHAIQTGVPHTNLSILGRVPLSLPDLGTQRAIAHILGTLDDKIELNRRMSETLEAMARALFKSWFLDFEPFRDDADAPEDVPTGWTRQSIGELTEVVGGGTPSTNVSRFWDGGRHSWATPRDLSRLHSFALLSTERRITDEGLAQISSGLLPAGTVLLSSRAPIGYLALADAPVAINQGFIAMKPRPPVTSSFLLLWAREAQEEILSRANGSTFLEISKSNFRPIPVIRPPDDVLREFDRIAEPLLRRVVSSEKDSITLATLRDTLLPKLISGELRVKDAERIVARAV